MTREEAIQKLLETDDDFRSWYEEHKELKWKVHKLEKHFPPDPKLEAEQERLKIRKLYLKDLMEKRIREFLEKGE
ncbi:MAG: dihydroxy-acid dehydratase [Persephonella sp.]|nr:MAG: dihydroxy-acid dehydratase [Persephonella sp.]RUM61312.1 MAG: dihydroxy-acid dehydratase [Persephonella sp.]